MSLTTLVLVSWSILLHMSSVNCFSLKNKQPLTYPDFHQYFNRSESSGKLLFTSVHRKSNSVPETARNVNISNDSLRNKAHWTKRNGIEPSKIENTGKTNTKAKFTQCVDNENLTSKIQNSKATNDPDTGNNQQIPSEVETLALLLNEINQIDNLKNSSRDLLFETLNEVLEEHTVENVVKLLDDFLDIVSSNESNENIDSHSSKNNVAVENNQNFVTNNIEFEITNEDIANNDELQRNHTESKIVKVTEQPEENYRNNSNNLAELKGYDALAKKKINLVSVNITIEQAVSGLGLLFLNCLLMCCVCIHRVGICGWLCSLCGRKYVDELTTNSLH